MTRKLKFIWIDDEDKQKDATNLEKSFGVKCPFVNVKPEDIDYIEKIDTVKPDLILVDHNLVDMGTGDIRKGSTMAALIREKHPKYPIVCITKEVSSVDAQQELAYEAIFSYDSHKENFPAMKAIALAYKKMKEKPPKRTDDLLELLNAPDEEKVRLGAIIPHEIKNGFRDPGAYSKITHWIRNTLIERPGFLYDRLWAATLLGLNESGFKKVERLFAGAKYKGIFADELRERWWKSELLEILSKKVKKTGLPWEKGRDLDGISVRNYSKDYYSDFKEDYPEVVAFVDENLDERAPMKLKYTLPHPKYDKLLFFEEIRMMKGE